jgi:fatty-acyl-CoA synthase
VGAKLVMPGAQLDGAALYEMLEGEGVTMAGAVPTLWQGLLTHLEATGARLSTLKRVLTGGSACPEALMRGLNERGIEVLHAWGMTESSPMATHATPSHAVTTLPVEEQVRFRLKQGRASVAVELKLADDDGRRLPHDGKTFGRLMMRGPYVVDRYYRGEGGDILDADHYFDTGDIATIDGYGYVQLTDRAKDVIKSGGEWISSIEIENLAVGHPKAALAAVIGIAHPKWDERPLLLIKLKDGQTATAAEILAFLEGKIAKWWMPDQVLFVDDIPLGATGKIDKKRIREAYAGYRLQTG